MCEQRTRWHTYNTLHMAASLIRTSARWNMMAHGKKKISVAVGDMLHGEVDGHFGQGASGVHLVHIASKAKGVCTHKPWERACHYVMAQFTAPAPTT